MLLFTMKSPSRSLRLSRATWLAGLVVSVVALGIFFNRGPNATLRSVVVVNPVSAEKISAAPSWDERWRQWLGRLPTPGHDAELAAEFERLIAADPARAFALARREADPARRACLLQTILLLWAEFAPDAAALAARALPDAERATGIAAVLAGAGGRPEIATRLAAEFCRDDPDFVSEHGFALITALGRNGDHRAAIRFALGEAPAVNGEESNKWLRAAFTQWAEKNPAAAMAAIAELPGEGARFEAWDAIAASRGRMHGGR